MKNQRKDQSDPNSLVAFSDMLQKIGEETMEKQKYSRALLEKLDIKLSDKAQALCDLVHEIENITRVLMGSGSAVDKETADELADRLPQAVKDLEEWYANPSQE